MRLENEPTHQTKKPNKNYIFPPSLCHSPYCITLASWDHLPSPCIRFCFQENSRQEILQTYFPPLFPFLLVTITKTWRHQYPMYFTNSRILCILFFILKYIFSFPQLQFSSVTQLRPTLCDPMNHSTPGLPDHHQPPGFTQTHIHRVGETIQPSHPLLSPFPPAPIPPSISLFQWVITQP